MKKGRTSTKSKGNLAAHVAKVEEHNEWGMNDQAEAVAAAALDEDVEAEEEATDRRHPQL